MTVSGSNVPEERIKELKALPNNKIVIVSTSKPSKVLGLLPKIKGFKNFKVEQVDEKVINKAIASSFGVKQNVAEILREYLKTDEEIFDELDLEKFEA